MTDLLSLAARVEQLTGHNIEINKLIPAALGYTWNGALSSANPDGCWQKSPQGPFLKDDDFTGSLDAAMTLVPEGLPILIRDGYDDAPGDKRPYAHIMNEIGEGYAATKALAIVVASLRARAALEGSHE